MQPSFDKPTDSESQTNFDNGADDISTNVNKDNRARESDQGNDSNVVTETTMGARRRGHGAMLPPPPLICNKVLKPNFQPLISQINNGCSLLSFILAKLLLLDISCENVFALSMVAALTACPFSMKKCAKVSVFYVKTVKILWQLGATPPDPLLCPPPLCQILGAPLDTTNHKLINGAATYNAHCTR